MTRTDSLPADIADAVIALSRDAGSAILAVYRRSDVGLQEKDDRSPLTEADLAAHKRIVERLQLLTPDIPILSEESQGIAASERQQWGRFWLVDPLDGTKEFLKRNGEFTVNIALVAGGRPVWGVVHAPDLERTWWGGEVAGAVSDQGSLVGNVRSGAWMQVGRAEPEAIAVDAPPRDGEPWRVVASRSHRGEAVDAFLAQLGPHECLSMGSSLKICAVADGRAHCYPRLGPTSEWDTAAAHAVVNAAGGVILAADSDGELVYNKDDILNPHFLVAGRETAAAVAGWR